VFYGFKRLSSRPKPQAVPDAERVRESLLVDNSLDDDRALYAGFSRLLGVFGFRAE
jgi:hypothetical protein